MWYMGGTTKADMYCHSCYDSTASSFRLSAWPGQRHNPGEQYKDVSDLGRREMVEYIVVVAVPSQIYLPSQQAPK